MLRYQSKTIMFVFCPILRVFSSASLSQLSQYSCLYLGFFLCLTAPNAMLGEEASDLPSMDTLRRKHIEFSKGSSGQLNSFYMSGAITTYDGAEARSSSIKIFKKRPNKLRSSYEQVTDDWVYKIEFIYDGNRGVRLESINGVQKRKELLADDALKAIQEEAYFDGVFLRASESMEAFKVEGIDTVKGVECVRLSYVGSEFDHMEKVWLRLDNFQEAKYRNVIEGDDGVPIIEEIFFNNHIRSEESVFYPATIEKFVDGALVYQFNSGEFKSNLGLFDSFFKIEEIATGI